MSQTQRFEIIHEEKHGLSDVVRVLRDAETGVCYLQTRSGPSGGVTLLVDRDGRPLTASDDQPGWDDQSQ